jgi:hypothetical protein
MSVIILKNFQAKNDVTVNSVLHLHVRKPDSEQTQAYSFERLKDLQSKLMLVAGQAEMEEGHIEKFVEVCFRALRILYL